MTAFTVYRSPMTPRSPRLPSSSISSSWPGCPGRLRNNRNATVFNEPVLNPLLRPYGGHQVRNSVRSMKNECMNAFILHHQPHLSLRLSNPLPRLEELAPDSDGAAAIDVCFSVSVSPPLAVGAPAASQRLFISGDQSPGGRNPGLRWGFEVTWHASSVT